MFWKQKKTVAIRIKHIISKVEMLSEIKSGSEKQISSMLEQLEKNQELFRHQVKVKYSLDELPNLQIKYLTEPETTEDNTSIIAEVIFIGQDIPELRGISWFSKLLLVASIWSLIGFLSLIGILAYEPEVPDCKVIFVEDKPLKIRIESTEYSLQEDGTISLDTKVHMNPWHQKLINAGQCTRQNM